MNPRRHAKIRALYASRALAPFDGTTNAADVFAEVNLVEEVVSDREAWICDVGCGRGWHLSELQRRGFEHLVGVDLALGQLVCAPMDLRGRSLVCANIFHSPLAPVFDAATAFLCCLGAAGAEAEIRFIQALAGVLLPWGAAVVSIFTADTALEMVGEFDVAYDRNRPEQVRSSVRIKRLWGKQFLCIAQRAEGIWSGLLREVIRLPTRNEVEALLLAAGFARVTWVDALPRARCDGTRTICRGRSTLVAWRSHGNDLPEREKNLASSTGAGSLNSARCRTMRCTRTRQTRRAGELDY